MITDPGYKQFCSGLFVLLLLCSCSLPIARVYPVRSDAIVLLAGDYKGRAPAAAQLYHAGYAPRIILTNDGVYSSWSTKYNRNLYQIEWAEEELVGLGVPKERIVKLPFYGSATIFDALATRQYIKATGLRKIIIVTADYHIRRALWTFNFVLRRTQTEISMFPAKSTRLALSTIVLEQCKFAYYWLRFGVLKNLGRQMNCFYL